MKITSIQTASLSGRILAFRLLESLAELCMPARRDAGPGATRVGANSAERSLWLFVSTIGELNAIQPLIDRLLEALAHPPLTLISDRSTYDAAYRTRYPLATIERLAGSWSEAQSLVSRRPPLMMVVAEIPGLLHDAPCRLSFATVHVAKAAGAPVVLVNGWLYGYTPPSRLDRIENRLFQRDYVRTFDLLLVQTDEVRQRLVAAGADSSRAVVTGNIKFDAMQTATGPEVPLGAVLRSRPAPIIVAGSVTETADQRAVLAAFMEVRRSHPAALLVLAPRHPENIERMMALHALLQEQALPYRLRSVCSVDAAAAAGVLVIDTMGELRSCYASATLAFVGTDHNVLEPLAFGKPVYVTDGWHPTYPSYPVYRQLLDEGLLYQVAPLAELGRAWCEHLARGDASATRESDRVALALTGVRGAVNRTMQAIAQNRVLESVGAR